MLVGFDCQALAKAGAFLLKIVDQKLVYYVNSVYICNTIKITYHDLQHVFRYAHQERPLSDR